MNPSALTTHFPAAAGLAIFLSFLAVSALAQGTSQERSDCIGDAFRYCASDIPNVALIEACLMKNEDRLSLPCRSEFSSIKKTKLRREHFRH